MTHGGFSKKRKTSIPLLVFIGYFLVFSPFYAFASDTGEKEITLTLSQVVEFALANERSVLDAQDNYKIAQSNFRIAHKEKGFNPTVQVTGDVTLVGEAESKALLSISDSVALNETSSDLANQLEQADISVKQAQNALENAEEKTKLKAITTYLDVLKAEWTTEMAQKTLEQAQTLEADMENQYQLGMASSVDLLKAKQTVERSRINLNQSNQSLLFKKQQLNQMIGYPLDTPISLEKDFPYQPLTEELDQLTTHAQSDHTNLKDLLWQKEIETITLKQIERNRQAKIHLIGSYVEENYTVQFDLHSPDWVLDWKVTGQLSEGDNTFSTSTSQDPFAPSATGWGLGLEVTWIPFDGGIAKERKQQQEIILAQIERKLKALPDSITLEVFDAYQLFLQSDQAVLTAQLEKQIAEETYRLQSQQYQAGFISDRTLKESELTLESAILNYQKALYDYILSKAQLYRVAGKKILVEEL